MTQQSVEIVQAAFGAFQQGDIEGVLRLCDENIKITQDVRLPGVPRHQYGHSGVLEAFALWPEQWDDFRVEVLRVADVQDRVLVSTVNRGRGKISGVEVEQLFTFLFSIRAGKITTWRIFVRESEALEAAGLED